MKSSGKDSVKAYMTFLSAGAALFLISAVGSEPVFTLFGKTLSGAGKDNG